MVGVAFLLINPFLGLVYSIVNFINKGKISPLVFSVSTTLILIYYPIFPDTLANFNVVKSLSFYNSDVTKAYYWYGLVFSDSFIYALSTFVFLIVFLNTLNFQHSMSNSSSIDRYDHVIFGLIFVFGIIDVRNILDLNRFYLAVTLCLFSYFCLKKTGWHIALFALFAFLAFNIHSSSIVIWFIVFFSYFLKPNITIIKILFLVSIVSSTVISNELIVSFADYLPFLKKEIVFYSQSNSWGLVSSEASIGLLVKKYVQILGLISCFYYLIYVYRSDGVNKNIVTTALLMVIFAMLFSSFNTFAERFYIIALMLTVFVVPQGKLNLNRMIPLLIILFFNFIFKLYSYDVYNSTQYWPESETKKDIMLKPFYTPTALLICPSCFGYSNDVIIKNSIN